MIRPMGEFTVSQRTKDGYFDGGDLLRQWNSVKGNEQRKMDLYMDCGSDSIAIGTYLNTII